MKIESPWSTDIVEKAGIEPPFQGLVRLWIWCDRAMWVCITVIAIEAARWFLK